MVLNIFEVLRLLYTFTSGIKTATAATEINPHMVGKSEPISK